MRPFGKLFNLLAVLCVSLLILTVFFPLACSKKQPETKEIKIGVILPLTGSAGNYGEDAKLGIELVLSPR